MKSSNTTAAKRVTIFLLTLVVVMGAGILWWLDGTAPVDQSDTTPNTFVVARGEGVKSIAQRLAAANLIRSPTGFYVLVKLMGIETQLQAGDFRLQRSMDAQTIARELMHGIVDIWVTTLEGWRVEEIAIKLAKELDIPEQEFLKHAKEGYMFPDTYLMPPEASPAAIAVIFLENFDNRVTTQMREDATRLGLSFDEVITLASIVEREGRTDADRPVIAGILLKRLKAGWPLQADATVQYALGYQPLEKTWWKKSLMDADKRIASPYNSYVSPGLPPAPVASPGLASIRATTYPQETDFWFYLHDPTGGVHYGRTLEEHEANIQTYLQ